MQSGNLHKGVIRYMDRIFGDTLGKIANGRTDETFVGGGLKD